MNINTIKTVLSFSDYVKEQVKCDNTAWEFKFDNSWNECDYWSGYIDFSIVAQVYDFNITYLPKGQRFKFPLPVKSYNPELFSSYVFNKVRRPTVNVKDFIVGDDFVLGQDLNSTEIRFYLTPDVKITKSNVLNIYKVVYLGDNSTAPLYFNIDLLCRPDCRKTSWWERFIKWGDCKTWEWVQFPSCCEATYWIEKFNSWGDCKTWAWVPSYVDCENTDWIHKFNNWGDCNTWS